MEGAAGDAGDAVGRSDAQTSKEHVVMATYACSAAYIQHGRPLFRPLAIDSLLSRFE